jgi:hypothetical protein
MSDVLSVARMTDRHIVRKVEIALVQTFCCDFPRKHERRIARLPDCEGANASETILVSIEETSAAIQTS